jgi:endoglucanase
MIRRREFSLAATGLAGMAVLPGCGGGGGTGESAVAGGNQMLATPVSTLTDQVAGAVRPVPGMPAMGTNLSGMEWAAPGLRYGASTAPNLSFTVPRARDVAYLGYCGFSKNRLPIQWELLQPMLHDTNANAQARQLIGEPGVFHAAYEAFITGVLDAHAAAGMQCIVDLHNYCRYQDFRFQGDGSVAGLVPGPGAVFRPYTTDGSQVQMRIFSLAAGATLRPAHFTDFWVRAARKWKDHPGFGGYGLMNEPHEMPAAGSTVSVRDANTPSYNEDLSIWPTFAQAAIDAIRGVDSSNPIYVGGNEWSAAMTVGTRNPGSPYRGANLVYEVHMYLDAFSNGWAFDYDTEVAKNFSAGIGNSAIGPSTGYDRLKIAVDWARSKGVKLALTEVGMPIDDPRWEAMFQKTMRLACDSACEVYSWMGGSHWATRNYALNHVTGWHQNKMLAPAVGGVMQFASGIAQATVFDDGPGYAAAGQAITITVYARGALQAPLTISITSNNGGTLSAAQVTLAAGSNSQASYTYTPGSNRVATLTYGGAAQVPPPRKVHSLSDPVAYAATSVADAARAIIAKYSACKWEMADGFNDYQLGKVADDGEALRAVSDSGYGSSPGNAMEMVNFVNNESSSMGSMKPPVMRTANGRKCSDHSAYDTFGLWCKKSAPIAGVQSAPKNRVPYNANEPHFVLAAVSVPGANNSGVVFQASKAEDTYTSDLGFAGSQPQASWVDANGQNVVITSPNRLAANTPAVVGFTCTAGAQQLRVNSAVVGSANATLAPATYAQMLIGWGFLSYYPREGFGGQIFSVITGKGVPSPQELAVLERYLASTAGVSI